MLTQEKINIILDKLEDDNTLKKIEDLLPAITDAHNKDKPKYKNIEVLRTASEVKLNPNSE